MPKIVVNKCYGGFGLSHKATLRYLELKGLTPYWVIDEITLGHHPDYNPNVDKRGIVHYGTQPNFMEGKETGYFFDRQIARDDPILVQVVEELGAEANGRCAELEVVSVPDGTNWQIEEYDGLEHVAEAHQTW